jgi:subtilisin family serine protease
MYRVCIFICLIAVCILVLGFASFARAANSESEKWTASEFLPGRLIVRFDPESAPDLDASKSDMPVRSGANSLDELFTRFEIKHVRRLVPDQILNRLSTPPDLYHTYVVSFAPAYPVLDVLDAFARDQHVKAVRPDLLFRLCRVPNDALWSSQWDKRIMNAHFVWDVSTGSRDIICAGIDTGVDWDHPDLMANLWVNPGEDLDHDEAVNSSLPYPGDWKDVNDIDDDENGYTDDLLGWDFVFFDSQNDCYTDEDCDSHTDNNMFGCHPHGTHVGGIMCAVGNNGIGVAGMCWNGRLMALRAGFYADDGNGYIPETASLPAILYAAANGAKIINMSYGGSGFSSDDQDAVNAAWNQGCLLVAASGNDGSSEPSYPAAYDNVIAVNATNNQERLASWSNRGWWTDLCAPGANPGIMSTVIDGYESWTGTSMASPNTAGAAALVWSVFPQLTNAELRDLLFTTAQDITAQNPYVASTDLGHGRVDAYAAVLAHATEAHNALRPAAAALQGNYPNPFNAATVIRFDVAVTTHVTLRIFDLLGRVVGTPVDETRSVGAYEITFDASHLAAGTYVAQLDAAGVRASCKMLLLK